MRRSVVERLGGFIEGEHRGSDREMWARIAMHYDIAYSSDVSVTYDCAAEGRESDKSRELQNPPALTLLEGELQKCCGHKKVSLQLYRNSLLFGHLGKSLKACNRNEMIATRKKIQSINVVTLGRKIWWGLVILLPMNVGLVLVRGLGSRYCLWFRRIYYWKHRIQIKSV